MDVQWKHFELANAIKILVPTVGLHSDALFCLAWPQICDEAFVVSNTDGGTGIEEDPTTFDYVTKLLCKRQSQLQ